jgi:hypothetical protein
VVVVGPGRDGVGTVVVVVVGVLVVVVAVVVGVVVVGAVVASMRMVASTAFTSGTTSLRRAYAPSTT